MSTLAKQIVGESVPPPIEELLPEMIRIANEGDVNERIAKLLVSKGYTHMDAWRELKKLIGVSSPHTQAIEYAVKDLLNGKTSFSYSNPVGELKTTLHLLKRKRRK
jgi:hypothetical protein